MARSRALGSALLALDLIDRLIESLEGCVEPFPASPVLFVVGFGCHIADQLVEVVLVASHDDAMLGRARPEHEPFTGGVDKHEAAKRDRNLSIDDHLEFAAWAGRVGGVSS